MGKKFSTVVLVLTVLLSVTALTSFATPPSSGIEVGFYLPRRIPFATPFKITFGWTIDSAPEKASADITIPDGIELQKGDLHWEGNIIPSHQHSMDLLICIKKPGEYALSAVINASNFQYIEYNKIFPLHRIVYLYAREDTVALYYSRELMEQQVRDSLIVPSEVIANRMYNYPKIYRDGNPQEFVSYWYDYVGYFEGISLKSLVDTSEIMHFPDVYTPGQASLIKRCGLMFIRPHVERLDSLVYKRYSTRSDEQIKALIKLFKFQLIELYDADQKVFHAKDETERQQLLKERLTLRKHQEWESFKISNTAKWEQQKKAEEKTKIKY